MPRPQDDIVLAIDDVRNGILLQANLHKILRQTLAFMPVRLTTLINIASIRAHSDPLCGVRVTQLPNFAMDTNDVVPGADPLENMRTIHLFEPLKSLDIAGARLAMPDSDQSRWPPPVLFDAIYGAVVLHEFGVHATRSSVTDIWEELYYPRGFEVTAAETRARKRRARLQRAVSRVSEPDYLDLTMLVPYLALPPDEPAQYFADMEDKAREGGHWSVAEKVRQWREGVASST